MLLLRKQTPNNLRNVNYCIMFKCYEVLPDIFFQPPLKCIVRETLLAATMFKFLLSYFCLFKNATCLF